jgi:hypothetical protein
VRTLAVLIALAAAPVAAQDSWPVATEGQACTTSRGGSSTSDALIVRYEPTTQRVSLMTAVGNGDVAAGTGLLELEVVFDKGKRGDLDVGWGVRRFDYRQRDERLDLSTAFAGSGNVKQVFDDLATSHRLGLVRDGKTVADFDLSGIGPAIARLRECPARQS